ncbi:uncharacterized protein LOC132626153 isoform X2 [Lycium barbarum]|uniref:uncharacterized protein LOC132626153 isoform X2 n=1 Tax=Lycium barbarum TaxID=112863 RepID=UPI00293F38E3|nr:uncharacterized protein LOC132626153 isoform X2 [Lycium barbarum]
MESSDASKKDIGWNYGAKGLTKDSVTCIFCRETFNGGITRHKQHLIGGYRNVKKCGTCPPEIREEVKKYVESKQLLKTQMLHQPSLANLSDEDDEMRPPPSKTQKMSSNASSTARTANVKGPMNLYYPQTSKGKGSSSTTASDASKKLLRDRAVSAFAVWVYDAGLPFNCVNHKSFDKYIETIGQYGPGMKPPTYHEIRVTHLKKEVEKIDEIIEEHKLIWTEFGCSIMMDKWTTRNGKMIINILVNSPLGGVFLGSVDASDESTNSTKMFNLFEKTIKQIGPENVIQVVTDNASENVKAGDMIMGVYPHIYWTPCAAHCINLMFGDIFKINPYASVFQKAIKIHSYVAMRPLLLNMMRRYTNQRNLVKPAKTRFATAFLTLQSFYMQKKNLRTMIFSTEWTESRFAKELLGKEVVRHLTSTSFWNDVVRALKVGSPLIVALRLVDGEKKPSMGYIYEAMDRAKEAIEKGFHGDRKQYEKVFEIIDLRWTDQLHRPLHAAGHVLNPGMFYTNYQNKTLSTEVWKGYRECVDKMVPNATQDVLIKELHMYKHALGTFGMPQAIRNRDKTSPSEWWSVFGNHTPNLQQRAIRVLSLTCSASGCERNWSVFEHIHTKKRNRLELSRLNNLVYIKYNRTLRRHYDVGDTVDPILLDNIDEANEWLIGCPQNEEEELVYEGCDLDWGTVSRASGVEENIYSLRGGSSSSRSHNKGKRVATIATSSLRSRCLIDENSESETETEPELEEEEDEEQYNVENLGYQEFGNLEDLEFE